MIEWQDSRLVLPGAAVLDVTVRGGSVRWSDGDHGNGALELHAPAGSSEDDTAELVIQTRALRRPSFVWVPHLTPEPNNVIGDWVFRSPAIVLADDTNGIAIAFIADVDDVGRASGFHAWMDYDHPRGAVTLAAGAYRHDGHVFFVREPLAHAPSRTLRLHVIASSAPGDLANPCGLAARFCWTRWGRSSMASAPPIDTHLERIVRWAFSSGWSESVWQPVPEPRNAGAPVFIVDVGRHPSVPPEKRTWREPRAIWNQAWFSTQRCANGLLRHARKIGDADLEDRAGKMTAIALAAPETNGFFPSVLRAHDGGWHWTNSDRRPHTVTEHACHLVDAAFTARKLLEWHELTNDARAKERAERLAARLLALQRPSGAFPAWVEPDGTIASELSESPESAVPIALLFDLGKTDAALRGAAFLEGVAREGRWEDFETYWSCARWGTPGERVARNGVFKQNTLSIAWCAESFFLAWRATNDAKWIRLARRCIDELSLHQAVWSPRFLPAPAHGGFGVMNADSEWSDARQSLFAPLYIEMGEAIGDEELVERGVSALRASFAMLYCPENAALARAYEKRFPFFGEESWGFMMENQGHDPAEPIGTFTIFTWGNGSALASVATVRDRFPAIASKYDL